MSGFINLADISDQAAPGANTDIISGGITIPANGNYSRLEVTVALATASVFNVIVTPSGGTARTYGMNSSVALGAGDIYYLSLGVKPGATYNFQVETDGIIRQLLVQGIKGA